MQGIRPGRFYPHRSLLRSPLSIITSPVLAPSFSAFQHTTRSSRLNRTNPPHQSTYNTSERAKGEITRQASKKRDRWTVRSTSYRARLEYHFTSQVMKEKCLLSVIGLKKKFSILPGELNYFVAFLSIVSFRSYSSRSNQEALPCPL